MNKLLLFFSTLLTSPGHYITIFRYMNKQLHQLVRAFKALSDPTRVRILKLLLKRKSLCVCEIMQALEMPQARISRHLAILREAGFVRDERHGLWVHYSIEDDPPTPYPREFTELLARWVERDQVIRDDARRLRKAVKMGVITTAKN